MSFCKNVKNKHVRIYMDNTTSCAYINNFGGKIHDLDKLAREIWFWGIKQNIHITAAYIPGKQNCEADTQSRSKNDDAEWSLKTKVFQAIKHIHPNISVDLFASRLNHQLEKYVTHRPEPNALAIDAFTLTWQNEIYFMFPPFSLIPRILQKVEEDGTEAVLVAPLWRTQSWWPCLLRLIQGQSYIIKQTDKSLYLPHKPEEKHPLKKLKLGVFCISGQNSKKKEFHAKQGISSYSLGEAVQSYNMIHTSDNGFLFVDKVLTPFNPKSEIF